MTNEPNRFSLIEMDPLPGMACKACGATNRDLDAGMTCRKCFDAAARAKLDAHFETMGPTIDAINAGFEATAPQSVAGLADALREVVTSSAANAAVQGAGSLRGGQLASVGFTSKEGYITAIRHGVKAATHASYLTTLRTQYGMTSADIAALNLPGPIVETTLPVGDGVVHVPAGHVAGSAGIFERPAEARQFQVGDAPAEYHTIKSADLKADRLVAVARSEGNGVVIAWNGRRTIRRADLQTAMNAIGAGELMPKATSARAQAGRTVGALNSSGLVVRVERRTVAPFVVGQPAKPAAPSYAARWTIGRVRHDVATGETTEALGTRVLQVTLTEDDKLEFTGDTQLAETIRDGYEQRLGEELYQSGDLTTWLGGILRKHCDAVEFGALGYYIPPKHAKRAGEICQAVASIGFGAGWVLPGLPVTDSDMLRDGILRGLTAEIDGLMERLATERAAAKESRDSGDIGAKRAETFIRDLRKIGERVVAYGVVLGDERVASAKARVNAALTELDQIRGADSGVERFRQIWDEIEFDRKRSGGVL